MFQQETAVLELFTRERVASDLGLLNIFNETYTTTLSARDNWIVEQADMLSQSATSTPFTRVIASSNNDVRVGTSIEWEIEHVTLSALAARLGVPCPINYHRLMSYEVSIIASVTNEQSSAWPFQSEEDVISICEGIHTSLKSRVAVIESLLPDCFCANTVKDLVAGSRGYVLYATAESLARVCSTSQSVEFCEAWTRLFKSKENQLEDEWLELTIFDLVRTRIVDQMFCSSAWLAAEFARL